AWLVQLFQLFLVLQVIGGAARSVTPAMLVLLLLAAVMVVRLLLYMIIVVVVVQAVISWVNPYSPLSPLLNTLSRPFLRPFQRRIPPIANVDLSPLFVIIVCQLLLILLANII
ncbi:MAG TPA: YggT family protein, partial [Burkholderiales bacterium]|nr:YggT family protein [Burkholderiales bacterium]